MVSCPDFTVQVCAGADPAPRFPTRPSAPVERTRPEIHGSLDGAGSRSFLSSLADDAPAPAGVGLVDALQDPLLGALWA